MGEQSRISWTDATFNPWIGCTRVSPACDRCYAERDNKRHKWVAAWGAGQPRKLTKYWRQPILWNLQAEKTGKPLRVFCASLADVFDNEVPDEWRNRLWALVRETKALRWILLTKRIGNAAKMLPTDWPFPNAGLMATIANQAEWDRDYPKLAATPATWRGVSVEPMLGPIEIGEARPDWIITGGESGPGYRVCLPQWVRSMRDQCQRNGVAFHHKQWSAARAGANGRDLDGREYLEFPTVLQG